MNERMTVLPGTACEFLVAVAETNEEARRQSLWLLSQESKLRVLKLSPREPIDLVLCHRKCTQGIEADESTKLFIRAASYSRFDGNQCGKGEYIGWNLNGKNFYKPAVYCPFCGYAMSGPEIHRVVIAPQEFTDAKWVKKIQDTCNSVDLECVIEAAAAQGEGPGQNKQEEM